MRAFFIILLVIVVNIFNVTGIPINKLKKESQDNKFTNPIVSFQNHFKQNTLNLDIEYHKVISEEFLNSILYFNIRKYHKEINYLYKKSLLTLNTDTSFYINCLRAKTFSTYQNKNYSKAVTEFRHFFDIYKKFYKNDTSYIFEFSKYCGAIKNSKSEYEYFRVMDTAIMLANKKLLSSNGLALTYAEMGKYLVYNRNLDTGRYVLNMALEYIKVDKNKNNRTAANVYNNIGYSELLNSNYELALINFNLALDELLNGDHTNLEIAILYKSIAISYTYLFRLVDAQKLFKMAIHIFKENLPNGHFHIRESYRHLGIAEIQLHEYPEAIKNLSLAYNLSKNKNEPIICRNLAEGYSSLDSINKAQYFYQKSLENCLLQFGKTGYQTGYTKYSYGIFLLEKKKQYEQGEKYLKESIEIMYQTFNGYSLETTEHLNILGTHYLNTGQKDRGLDTLQSAFSNALGKQFSNDIYLNPNNNLRLIDGSFGNTLAWKAYGFYLKYLESNDIKDLEMSFKTFDQYIELSKEVRKYYKDTESKLYSYLLNYVFNQSIDISRQLYEITQDRYYLEKTFEFIEGKKSYTLLNSLKILESKKLLKIPNDLLKRERALKHELGITTETLSSLHETENKDEIINLDSLVFSISESLDSIHSLYKSEYSEFYNLKYGFQELSLKSIENQLSVDKAFLNYSISDSLLTILCVTNNKTHMYNQVIDSSFYEEVEKMASLLKEFNTDNSYREFHQFVKTSRILYDYLIKPAEEHIQGKNLIIVPDDVLNYISFDALLTEDIDIERPDYRKLPYLIKKHNCNLANSMQIYYNMKSKKREANNMVYAFAPEYSDANDTTGYPEDYHFLRALDYAQIESKMISQYLPTIEYLGFNATEDTFFSEAPQAKILHLAMHTILDDKNPMYSKLLFTYDNKRKKGLVNTYELLTMDLNAELAVLSGCSTGDGKLQKGEGVMSLSSGFQYAGVPAIIMSLWEVNDWFGSLVIENFYENIALGLPKNIALHNAKLDVLSQGNALYAHPFYWSGLTLIGDDSKIDFKEKSNTEYIIYSLLALLIILVSFFMIKKQIA